jgi:glycosyltransferase involved in cell wall biosynthesis
VPLTGLHVAVDGVGLARPWAGVGVYTTEILKAMAVERPDCRFTVYVPPGVAAEGPSSVSYRKFAEVPFVGRHVQWPARLRRLRPDVFFGAAGALPLMDVGAPSVITVHDLAIYRNAGWFPSRQPLATRWVVPSSLRRADCVIAPSYNTARDAEELFGVPRDRLVVVPHGKSPAFRPMSGEELAAARERLNLPERFILCVGTIEPRKNLVTLLDAWAMMRDRPDLVIVGGWGWNYEPIRERMNRLGDRVHHLDALEPSHLPPIYNLARVLAHPAWYEGFGLPPLEAMACGTPVVVSDSSSLPEVVDDAGLVVPAGNADAWRKALEKVLGDTELAADMRRKGILRAAEFSWRRSAEMTWQVIDETLQAG